MVASSSSVVAPDRAKTRTIPFLDAVRGISALYVLSFHAMYWLHHSGAQFQDDHGAVKLLLSANPVGLFGFGHQAVLVFFVLSGFVIHLRQAQRPDERSSVGERRWLFGYARRRAIRIYVPLLFALALTALVGAVGAHLAGDFFGHPVQDRNGSDIVMNHNLSPVDALLVVLPVGWLYGSNDPLWSIQYEVWFYVAYAVVLLVLVDRIRISVRLTLALASVAALAAWLALISGVLSHQADFSARQLFGWAASSASLLIIYFPIWLVGALLAELYASGTVLRYRRLILFAGLVAIAGGLVWHAPGIDVRVPSDYLFALGTALLMAYALLRPAPTRAGRMLRLSAYTANWSYSLYVVHFPLIMLVRGLWLGNDPVPHGVALVLSGLLVGLAGGVVTWLLVERPSLRLAQGHLAERPSRLTVRWTPAGQPPRHSTGD